MPLILGRRKLKYRNEQLILTRKERRLMAPLKRGSLSLWL